MKSKLLILFILIILCVGTSAFAISEQDFLNMVDSAISALPNGRPKNGLKYLRDNNWYQDFLFTTYSNELTEANTVMFYSNSSTDNYLSPIYNFTIYFYRAFDDTFFYKNGQNISFNKLQPFLVGNNTAFYSNMSLSRSSGITTINTSNYQQATNIPFQNSYDNAGFRCFFNTLNKQIMSDSSNSSVTSSYYYVKDYAYVPQPQWTFTKYNNLKLNYSVNEMPLGTFSGDVNPKELNYIWVDYTTQQTIYNSFDYTGMYPSIYNRGMGLFIYNRLLKDHEYDLYIYKDNEDSQQFHYTYIYTSGDTGWNGQDTTNNIIDNNNQHQEDNTKQPDFNDYKVSGDSIISSLGVTFSGDPYSNVWFELTQGFSHAFTDTGNRVIELQLPDGNFFEVNINTISAAIPVPIKTILSLVVNVFLVAKIIKWVKLCTTMIQSGNIDDLITQNQEEGLTNLF